MAETSYIIQNGRRLNLKDSTARKSIGSCDNLHTETKHCLVDAINELNEKVGGGGGGTSLDGLTATVDELNALVGVDGNVQEQLDGKAPYGLINATHSADTDEALLADLDSVISGMANGTAQKIIMTGGPNTFLGGFKAEMEIFRNSAGYCTVKAYTYMNTAGGSIKEYNNSKYGGVWQEWTRSYNTGYKPKLTDLGLTATAAELNYVDGVTGPIQTQLNGKIPAVVKYFGTTQNQSVDDLYVPLALVSMENGLNAELQSILGGYYAYVFTMFYGSQSSTGNRGQIALNYNGKTAIMAFRHCDSTWTPWTKVTTSLSDLGITATADELNLLDSGITESKISHGATDHWENTLPPFTGIKVSRSRANRFALMPAEKVLVERSTDAGATWTEDTNFADADKVNLLTNAVANDTLRIMNNLSANERLRITLIAPSNSRTRINQIYTDISTRGHGVRVDIEGALNSAPNTFSVLGNNVRLGGWNGPNVINIPEITWGPSSSSDYGKIRITYKISAVSSSQTGKAIVLAIKGYGPYAFYMHSNLAFDDCLYEVNHNGDATFPANLTAKTIAGVSPTEIGYLAGATGNVQEQLNKIRETQTSGAEAMTEATIRTICT